MSTKTSRLTGLGLRDSFLPRVQALFEELDAATKGLNYLLYEVDATPDTTEESRLSTLLYVTSNVEEMANVLGRMK